MYWKITKDHLFEEDGGKYFSESRVGLRTKKEYKVEGEIYDLKLFDDDRELYYEAEADFEGMEAISEWAYRDAGVTITQAFDKKTGKWVDEIS